jgi:hypothetical protein
VLGWIGIGLTVLFVAGVVAVFTVASAHGGPSGPVGP